MFFYKCEVCKRDQKISEPLTALANVRLPKILIHAKVYDACNACERAFNDSIIDLESEFRGRVDTALQETFDEIQASLYV